jgi:Ca2+/Na+ antiporter
MELRAKLKNIFYIILRAIEEKKRCSIQNRLDRKVLKKFEGEENSSNPIQEEIVSRIKKLESIRSEEVTNQQQVVKVVARGSRLKHYFLLPLTYMLKFSIPNSEKYPKMSPISVVSSFLWLGVLCFFMVWWMAEVGRGLLIPHGVLGVIFVAAGLNVPKIINSVSKCLQGEEEVMLSHSIKPNNVAFTLAVGLAWFFYGVVTGKELPIDSAIIYTSLTLITALGCSYVFIGGFKWKLSRSLGVVLLFFYFSFLLFFLLLEFKQL